MGLKGKLTAESEVSTHGHHFHEFFAKKPHHISQISPTHIQGCELHEGEFGKAGSVIYWNYTIDGKACVAKEVIEKVDEENKMITFRVIEGDLLKDYSTFVIHLHSTDKEVKWVLEYEKIHEDVPHPIKELDFLFNISKHVDDHHKA
ncbi:hypothetical protein V2J09_012710 [Rumex salicifolius]